MNQHELYCRTCDYSETKPGCNPCKRCIAEGWDRKQLSLYESEDHLSESIRKEIESFIEKQIKRIDSLKKTPFNASDIYHNLALEKAIMVLRNSI